MLVDELGLFAWDWSLDDGLALYFLQGSDLAEAGFASVSCTKLYRNIGNDLLGQDQKLLSQRC